MKSSRKPGCTLCNMVEDICSQLPTVEGQKACRILADKVQRGEISPSEARRELLKYVVEQDIVRALEHVLAKRSKEPEEG